ncbi:RNA-binding family protein, putative isoform 1 [Theobroma cacao]|uniref:RNA-binding family protein, putative isoform 1 n=1 Tax=Theobroma cacao TaxID=3641 RepID=A0A061FLQ2_THECC|nr:RNA-binding family protein, putative isoform 1 [Theobroma cacao]
MSGSLDMSLDEIIRNRGRSEGHFRDSRRKPHGSGPGPGPDRRGPTHDPLRTNPYPVRPVPTAAAWHGQLVSSGGSDMEAKLCISNLDYGVSNEDVKLISLDYNSAVRRKGWQPRSWFLVIISILLVGCICLQSVAVQYSSAAGLRYMAVEVVEVLFSEVGDLKRYSINYDRSGRSKGTAEVVFYRQTDALAAIKRYNNVQLDGKPMTIELVGANVVMSAPIPPTNSSIVRNPNVAFRRDQEKVGGSRWVHGGGNGPNGGGAGRGFARRRRQGGHVGQKLSAEDLDADLDKYHLEATKIK